MTALARPVGVPVRRFLLSCLLMLLLWVVWQAVRELITFERQARLLASLADDITFRSEAGASPTIRFPPSGETDRRLGYTQLGEAVTRLEDAGFRVESQARWSPRLERVVELGLNAPYRRKQTAGLTIHDRQGKTLHQVSYPERAYLEFSAIPPLVVDSLLFIENRELLDDRHRYRNPAVEWDRLAHSLTLKAVSVVGPDRKTPGASTLATQLEKYHHSPGGRTESAGEKLRQMVSASLRAYLDGEDTVATRQRIVTEYLNTVPLAAAPGRGEVHGLGNGLQAWFGADFERVNALLAAPEGEEAALAYRQLLSLLIAQRRPSHYLLQDRQGLSELTDSYLRLLGREGVVRGSLLEQALASRLEWRPAAAPERLPYPQRKWPYFVRARLTELLGVSNLYDLDRWDLSVTTTVDGAVQARVTELLRSLADPATAEALGLREPDLLGRQDPAGVTYSVTLLEHVNGANVVRVQADNADRPLDINRGVKLDLGSSAKLRTLVTYLDVIARLHARYRAMNPEQLAGERAARNDPLGVWVLDRMTEHRQESLRELLQAAMARRYSASPGSAFFTGGGRHVFSNFDRKDDARVIAVAEAFERSVNLVFIRMMADIVAAHQAERLAAGDRIAAREPGSVRDAYLARFADQEGSEYLRRFYREYAGLPPAQVIERLLEKTRPTPAAFATVLATVEPQVTPESLAGHLQTHLKVPSVSPSALADLLARHGPDHLSLADRGYLARLHPLELWMAARLVRGEPAHLGELLAESADERQHVYQWLFKTRNKRAQDRRITMLLEQEAFIDIHAFWQRLGYPFASLVPSLATAIGSSADHPAALTELLGIIASGGVRHPTHYMTELAFATDTPYETRLGPGVPHSERVLPAEVAEVTRVALGGVVAKGTARRLKRLAPDLAAMIGGKTGTGDHRYERYGSGGRVLESRVVNRSAVFTFVIGDRFFGTVTAFVPGEAAGEYRFTSALPVQILGHLLPVLEPVLLSSPSGVPEIEAGQLAGNPVPPAAESG